MNCSPQSLAAAARCFASCIPQRGVHAVKNYLLCQAAGTKFFGGGGGGGFLFPIPLNFHVNSNSAGTQLTAIWQFPAPSGVTATEVWTSTDGVTYSLFSTVVLPAGTQTFAAIAVGSFEWFKIRWTNQAGGFSDFTAPIEWSGQAMDWAARATTNGGSPTGPEILNVNNLWITLVNGGVSSQILVLNPIAGINDANTSITPLIKGAGTDPWGNHNFNNTNFTINGFVGNGAIAMLTGFIPTSFASDNNAGVSVYDITASDDGNNYVWGGYDGANGIMSWHTNNTGNSQYDCFSLANRVTVATSGAGFYSVNRVAANDLRLFFGNSTNALAQVGATSALAGGARETINLDVGGLGQNNAGSVSLFTNHTISFWCAHNGLSLAQATVLFNAVQAYRVAMGGGFV